MKLENQVSSYEQGLRLKELGVNHGSIFYWFKNENIEGEFIDLGILYNPSEESVSAYTVAELGVMLGIDKTLNSYNDLIKNWYYQGYSHRDSLYNTYGVDIEQYTKNEAYRRAADLIVGLSIKRLTPEEVNTRLNNI